MSDDQRREFRDLYNRLRYQVAEPGEMVAGDIRKPYTPVNRDLLTFDEALALPDDPPLVKPLTGKLFWLLLGKHQQPIAKGAAA